MSKCAGNLPEFDDFEDNDEVERRRIHRARRNGKRRQPVRALVCRPRQVPFGAYC